MRIRKYSKIKIISLFAIILILGSQIAALAFALPTQGSTIHRAVFSSHYTDTVRYTGDSHGTASTPVIHSGSLGDIHHWDGELVLRYGICDRSGEVFRVRNQHNSNQKINIGNDAIQAGSFVIFRVSTFDSGELAPAWLVVDFLVGSGVRQVSPYDSEPSGLLQVIRSDIQSGTTHKNTVKMVWTGPTTVKVYRWTSSQSPQISSDSWEEKQTITLPDGEFEGIAFNGRNTNWRWFVHVQQVDITFTRAASVPNAPAFTQSPTQTVDNFVKLTWSPPNSDGGSAITNYNVYRQLGSGEIQYLSTASSENAPRPAFLRGILDWITNPIRTIISTPSTQFEYIDSTVQPGASYTYYVSASNAAGEGPMSSGTQITTLNPLGQPTLSQIYQNGSTIHIEWNPPDAEGRSPIEEYEITRSTASAGPSTTSTTALPIFIDQGILPDTTYSYSIAARNSDGLSGSLSTSITTSPWNFIVSHGFATNNFWVSYGETFTTETAAPLKITANRDDYDTDFSKLQSVAINGIIFAKPSSGTEMVVDIPLNLGSNTITVEIIGYGMTKSKHLNITRVEPLNSQISISTASGNPLDMYEGALLTRESEVRMDIVLNRLPSEINWDVSTFHVNGQVFTSQFQSALNLQNPLYLSSISGIKEGLNRVSVYIQDIYHIQTSKNFEFYVDSRSPVLSEMNLVGNDLYFRIHETNPLRLKFQLVSEGYMKEFNLSITEQYGIPYFDNYLYRISLLSSDLTEFRANENPMIVVTAEDFYGRTSLLTLPVQQVLPPEIPKNQTETIETIEFESKTPMVSILDMDSRVALQWTRVRGAVFYRVYQSNESDLLLATRMLIPVVETEIAYFETTKTENSVYFAITAVFDNGTEYVSSQISNIVVVRKTVVEQPNFLELIFDTANGWPTQMLIIVVGVVAMGLAGGIFERIRRRNNPEGPGRVVKIFSVVGNDALRLTRKAESKYLTLKTMQGGKKNGNNG